MNANTLASILTTALVSILCTTLWAQNYLCQSNIWQLNTDEKKYDNPSESFVVADNLHCTITVSTDEKMINQQVSLIGLATDNPKMLSGATGGTSPLVRLYDSEDTLVVSLVASFTGSSDTFTLNKKNGYFVRTTSGNFLGTYATASKGICR